MGSEEFKKQNKNKHQEQQSNVARGKKEENKPLPPNPMDVLMKYQVLLEGRGRKSSVRGRGYYTCIKRHLV